MLISWLGLTGLSGGGVRAGLASLSLANERVWLVFI